MSFDKAKQFFLRLLDLKNLSSIQFMLLIRTYLAKSRIHGIGVFAREKIPKGTKIWKFIPGLDVKIGKEILGKLPQPAREQIIHYSYINKVTGEYVLPADNDRFTNHSENPNTTNIGFGADEGETYAARDIEEGEEITTNYKEIDPTDPPIK